MLRPILIATFFASSAWACPDLSGHFVCADQDSIGSHVVITQTLAKNSEVWVYQIAQGNRIQEYIADGVSRRQDVSVGGIESETVTCQGNSVSFKSIWYVEDEAS